MKQRGLISPFVLKRLFSILVLVFSPVVLSRPANRQPNIQNQQDCAELKRQVLALQDLLQEESATLSQLQTAADEQAAKLKTALNEFNKWSKNYSHINGFEE